MDRPDAPHLTIEAQNYLRQQEIPTARAGQACQGY